MKTGFEVAFELVGLAPGYPSGKAGQGAAAAHAFGGSLGQGPGKFDLLAGFVQARAVAVAHLVKDHGLGTAAFGDPLAFLAQPFARRLGVGAQFHRNRHFAPAGLRQQAAHFVMARAGAGDDRIDVVAKRVEGGDQETGHRQRFAKPLEAAGGKAADVDREQPVGAQQVGKIHVEMLELGQGFLQGIEVLYFVFDPDLDLIGGKTTAQDFLEPAVESFQVVQRRRLGVGRKAQS